MVDQHDACHETEQHIRRALASLERSRGIHPRIDWRADYVSYNLREALDHLADSRADLTTMMSADDVDRIPQSRIPAAAHRGES